jgi:ATP-binding cassette subfamily B protein
VGVDLPHRHDRPPFRDCPRSLRQPSRGRLRPDQLATLAELSTQISERFNVALLVTLFGRPDQGAARFEGTSEKLRVLGVRMSVYSRLFLAALLVMAGLITALIFGWGGVLVSEKTSALGTRSGIGDP